MRISKISGNFIWIFLVENFISHLYCKDAPATERRRRRRMVRMRRRRGRTGVTASAAGGCYGTGGRSGCKAEVVAVSRRKSRTSRLPAHDNATLHRVLDLNSTGSISGYRGGSWCEKLLNDIFHAVNSQQIHSKLNQRSLSNTRRAPDPLHEALVATLTSAASSRTGGI